MKKYLVMFAVLMSFATNSFAGTVTNWEKVYEHDPAGLATAGNINDLKTAVLAGSGVKVMLHFASGRIEIPIELSKVRVEMSSTAPDATVLSIIGFYSDNTPLPGGQAVNGVYDNTAGLALRVQSLSTTGQFITYYPANTGYGPSNTAVSTVGMSWYVSR